MYLDEPVCELVTYHRKCYIFHLFNELIKNAVHV